MKNQEQPSTIYYKLFKHIADEHNLILVDSELSEIVDICEEITEETTKQGNNFLNQLGISNAAIENFEKDFKGTKCNSEIPFGCEHDIINKFISSKFTPNDLKDIDEAFEKRIKDGVYNDDKKETGAKRQERVLSNIDDFLNHFGVGLSKIDKQIIIAYCVAAEKQFPLNDVLIQRLGELTGVYISYLQAHLLMGIVFDVVK